MFEAEVAHVRNTPSGVQQRVALDHGRGAVLEGNGNAVYPPRPFGAGALEVAVSFVSVSISVGGGRVLNVVDFDAVLGKPKIYGSTTGLESNC
jgi:hypothetical protein